MSSGKQTAIVTKADGSLLETLELDIPICARDSVLVKVHSLALNPSDFKMPLVVKHAGLVVGCDFAGEIIEVGADVNALQRYGCEPWVVGDRVTGAVHGSNTAHPSFGSFAQFINADPLILIRIPPTWSWASAAAVGGSCVGAVGLALFKELQLDISKLEVDKVAKQSNGTYLNGNITSNTSLIANSDLKKVVLVYGGSTACGTIAIQLLHQ
jgi:aspyridone synthetase trans-acting enoyl reductase